MADGAGSGSGAEAAIRSMAVATESRRSSGRRAEATKKSPAAFRTISEVSRELDVPQHVLRFWETKFSQIRPMKRGGGRRYYRPEDITLLRGIKAYLYADGYTIRGVQKLLKEHGVKILISRSSDDHVSTDAMLGGGASPEPTVPRSGNLDDRKRAALQSLLDDLEEIRRQLTAAL